MKPVIGTMQGRLVPPIDGKLQCFPEGQWEREFPLARQAGLDCIEWIYDLQPTDNPIASPEGVVRITELVKASAVAVRSVCADYFMRRPLFAADAAELDQRSRTLFILIRRASTLGVNRIVIPFVDESSLRSEADHATAATLLRQAAAEAARFRIAIDLETDMPPRPFAQFLDRIGADNVRVNYDSGNSASLGFSPTEELDAYGDRLGSVHIKDRVRGGGSVPLGTGNADFKALFAALRRCAYSGDFILQAARGQPGDEVAHCRANRAFIEACLAG